MKLFAVEATFTFIMAAEDVAAAEANADSTASEAIRHGPLDPDVTVTEELRSESAVRMYGWSVRDIPYGEVDDTIGQILDQQESEPVKDIWTLPLPFETPPEDHRA